MRSTQLHTCVSQAPCVAVFFLPELLELEPELLRVRRFILNPFIFILARLLVGCNCVLSFPLSLCPS